MKPAIYCADVGSIPNHNFGWAGIRASGEYCEGQDIGQLARYVANDVDCGPVALGFECPLFVPLTSDPEDLLSCRPGEGARAWSASAGVTTLGAGIVECAWILREVRSRCSCDVPLFLNPGRFESTPHGLLIWEAFVTGKRRSTHVQDAALAVEEFGRNWPHLHTADALKCDGMDLISLAGLAALRTGWSADTGLLSEKCLVVRASSAIDLKSLKGIRDNGFVGFEAISQVQAANCSEVPELPGIYLILRRAQTGPEFLDVSIGGRFKGQDPTVPVSALQEKWVEGAIVLYIGKGGGPGEDASLKGRLSAYMKFGQGHPKSHAGGKYIWQLKDSSDLLVCWKVLSVIPPRLEERRLISIFEDHYQKLPFANLNH